MSLVKIEDKLERCPFCGGEALFHELDGDNGVVGYYVECTECEACTMYTNDKKDAIKRWNRRVNG